MCVYQPSSTVGPGLSSTSPDKRRRRRDIKENMLISPGNTTDWRVSVTISPVVHCT